MSENPDLLNLGVDVDNGSFAALNTAIDALQSRISTLAEGVTEAFLSGDDAAINFLNTLNDISRQTEVGAELSKLTADETANWSQKVSDLNQQVEKLTADYQKLDQAVAETNQTAAETPSAQGADQSSSGGDSGGDSGSGKIGSAFGIGHGLSVAGHALGMPALREAGGIIYIEEALRRVGPLFDQMNAALEASGGIIPVFTEALVALDIPMAGLAATLLPIAAAIAAVGAALILLKNSLDQSKEAIAAGITQVDAYWKAVAKGTAESLGKEIDSLSDRKAAAQGNLDQINQQIASAMTKAMEADKNSPLGMLAGNTLKLGGEAGFKELGDSAKALRAELLKLQEQIDADTKALTAQQVVANTHAELVRKQATDQIADDSKFRADDRLTMDAAKAKVQALADESDSVAQAIATIREEDQAQGLSAAQHKANKDTIDKLTETLKSDGEEITHLVGTSYGLIKARQDEADALAAQDAALKRHISFMEQEGRLKATGTPQQVESAEGTLKGRIAGDEYAIDALKQRVSLTAAEQKELERLNIDLVEAKNELYDLDHNIKPLVEAGAALKELAKAADDLTKKTEAAHQERLTKEANARAKEQQAEEQYQLGSLQDLEQRQKIKTDESRKEATAEAETANRITDIRAKLGEQESQIATNFSRQMADDALKYNDNQQKIDIDIRRQEAADLTDHLNKLSDIRRNEQFTEQGDLLTRNFAKLAQDRLHAQQAESGEDTSYGQREAKLMIHLKQQEEDAQRALAIQVRDQQIAEQQKLNDAREAAADSIQQAQTAEQRKISALRMSEGQQLSDLSVMEGYKIQLLRVGLQNELTLYAAQERDKIALLKNTQTAIAYQAAQAYVQNGFAGIIQGVQGIGGLVSSVLASGASGGSSSQHVTIQAQGYGMNEVVNQIASIIGRVIHR